MKLQDKIAIVTGASSGMGKSIALEFAKEGAIVVAVARRKERLDDLAKEAAILPGSITPFQGDVGIPQEIQNLFAFVRSTYGKLDVLVNNAGIVDAMTPTAEVTDSLWEKVMAVNLTGPFTACREALQIMLPQGKGNIINVASIGGLHGGRAGTAYTASKWGLLGLTQNIAWTYLEKGIRCNGICPGGVDTEISVGMANATPFGIQRATEFMPRVPMGKPEQIAKVALFLASDDSSIINGSIIVADAGQTAY